MLQNLATLEESILLGIQSNLRNEWLTPVFIFITRLGNGGFIWILGSILLLVPKKTRKIGVMALAALAGSVLIDNVILKNVVARTRPYEVIGGLTSLIGIQKDFSFPSGHTGSSFAVAVVMFRGLPKKFGVPALILAFPDRIFQTLCGCALSIRCAWRSADRNRDRAVCRLDRIKKIYLVFTPIFQKHDSFSLSLLIQ